MKFQMLPTTFDERGYMTNRQHYSCLVIDDTVAVDAGSLANSSNQVQKEHIRNVVLTHAHLDHIAGLPLFIDDLFATLREPVCVYGSPDVLEILQKHIFNWEIYPDFNELKNKFGEVLRYQEFAAEQIFSVAHLNFKAIEVNHKVASFGFTITDNTKNIAISGDTSEMERFWQVLNQENSPDALLIECAFPDALDEIAYSSHHLTPRKLKRELEKFNHKYCPVFAINLKPAYRDQIIDELNALKIANLQILEIGRVYEI